MIHSHTTLNDGSPGWVRTLDLDPLCVAFVQMHTQRLADKAAGKLFCVQCHREHDYKIEKAGVRCTDSDAPIEYEVIHFEAAPDKPLPVTIAREPMQFHDVTCRGPSVDAASGAIGVALIGASNGDDVLVDMSVGRARLHVVCTADGPIEIGDAVAMSDHVDAGVRSIGRAIALPSGVGIARVVPRGGQ